jgi:TolB protein
MKMNCKPFLTAALLCAWSAAATAQEEPPIRIIKPADYTVPVSISGFQGEVESVLKFDLSVLGMAITTPEKADYLVSGKANGGVEGSLTQSGSSRPLWLRAYNGSTPRSLAHAFADDIAKEIRGTAPIFQTKIAFRLQQGASTEIAMADYDGYHVTQLTHDGKLVDGPAWIPGGRSLLYTSWQKSSEEILEQDLATGARRVFANHPGANLSPAVSPDGRKVAMILSRNGSPNLWVCDLHGGGLLQLTRTREEDSCPCWSPDSREICFVCRAGRARMQIIGADGGPARPLRVAGVSANMTAPNWSPDGKWIAFTSGSVNFTLCVVSAEGGDAQILVAGEDPCWAPNSRTIIFARRVNNKSILCLLDVPTKHVKDVRQISGSCSEPSWAR